MPTIDVLIPARNAGSHITETLHGILQQTLQPERIIVAVDAASTDDTIDKINAVNSPLVHILMVEPNCGVSAARNAAICQSVGDYVAFCDSDDIWLPTKLEKQVQQFKQTSVRNCGCVYVGHDFITTTPQRSKILAPFLRGDIHDALLHHNYITGSASSVMMTRECLMATGYFDESLIFGEDWDLWLRASRSFGFDYVDERLVNIRLHEHSSQHHYFNRQMDRVIRDQLVILNKVEAYKRVPKRAYERCYRQILHRRLHEENLPFSQRLSLYRGLSVYYDINPHLAPVPLWTHIKVTLAALARFLKEKIK